LNRALFVALALALSACADNGETNAAPTRNPLVGTQWVMTGGGADAPTIEFTDSRASGGAGCNRWFAQAVGSDAGLTFTAIGSTRRMCEADVMDTERAFLAVLRDTRFARIENGVLVLRGAGGMELARFDRVG
jgi:heat shock protein HslJ